MRHTFVALVEDKPGVLNRVVSLFRRRTFNIESLTVGHTDHPGISRITIVVDSEQVAVERITPYLYKLINVLQVEDLTHVPMVNRDLAMVKVRATPDRRVAIMQLVDVFRARVVDVTNDSLIAEITGDEDKIDGFVDVLRPYGIIEMVRTGVVAMERGANTALAPAYTSQNNRSSYHGSTPDNGRYIQASAD
ncbi:MAG TPA: acetolactate synthase small subunit [Anaerolineaceae bacterium]|nr:acetolactate synthase small subunit [Anaerolineaceae bacterium]